MAATFSVARGRPWFEKNLRYYVLVGATAANGLIWWIVLTLPLQPTQFRNLLILAIGGTVGVIYWWLSPLWHWGIGKRASPQTMTKSRGE